MIKIESFYSEYFKPGNVSTDSRNIIPKGIFIALKGENFNGNTFAAQAVKAGARVAVVDEIEFQNNENIFYVDNTLRFLQELAVYHRKISGFKVLALTGTNGKTTTKELIQSVLSQKYNCRATRGNLNNHIGVPLTLLSIPAETEFAIIEMGANHPGEIKQLCNIAQPDYGLITNIGKAHLEGFGSFEGVIKTKSELFEFIQSTQGIFFYNALNPILNRIVGNYSKTIKYNSESTLFGKILDSSQFLTIEIYPVQHSSFTINSNLYGEYNFENILAAASIGLEFGIGPDKIKKGIESYIPDNNRSQIIHKGSNTLIVDCYNANPTSMQEAIQSFSKTNKESRLAILGGMRELGEYSKDEHKKLIEQLKQVNIKEVILLGDEFNSLDISDFRLFLAIEQLIAYLKETKFSNHHILIKGSRGNKLEQVIDYL